MWRTFSKVNKSKIWHTNLILVFFNGKYIIYKYKKQYKIHQNSRIKRYLETPGQPLEDKFRRDTPKRKQKQESNTKEENQHQKTNTEKNQQPEQKQKSKGKPPKPDKREETEAPTQPPSQTKETCHQNSTYTSIGRVAPPIHERSRN